MLNKERKPSFSKNIILKIKYCFVRKWVSPKRPEPSGWPDDEPPYSDMPHYEYTFTANLISEIGKFVKKKYIEILTTLLVLLTIALIIIAVIKK